MLYIPNDPQCTPGISQAEYTTQNVPVFYSSYCMTLPWFLFLQPGTMMQTIVASSSAMTILLLTDCLTLYIAPMLDSAWSSMVELVYKTAHIKAHAGIIYNDGLLARYLRFNSTLMASMISFLA